MEKQGTTTYLQRHIAKFFRKLHPVSMSQLLQVIARRERQHGGAVSQVTCVFDHDAGFFTMTITFDPPEKLSRFPAKHRANNCFN